MERRYKDAIAGAVMAVLGISACLSVAYVVPYIIDAALSSEGGPENSDRPEPLELALDALGQASHECDAMGGTPWFEAVRGMTRFNFICRRGAKITDAIRINGHSLNVVMRHPTGAVDKPLLVSGSHPSLALGERMRICEVAGKFPVIRADFEEDIWLEAQCLDAAPVEGLPGQEAAVDKLNSRILACIDTGRMPEWRGGERDDVLMQLSCDY